LQEARRHTIRYRRFVATVDVVVVSYNSRARLRACIERLAAVPELQIVVVDSNSQDQSLEAIGDLPVEAIQLRENRGFGYACNIGWRHTQAPYVLFLNPDATIDRDSIERLVQVADDPAVGAVAPKILGTDGSIDYSMRRFPRLRSTYSQALFLHRLFPSATWSDELVRDANAYDRPARPEWASGACLLVKRAILERLDGFDEGFFLYCEDLDLCRRLKDQGFELRFQPEAVSIHEGGASMPRAALLSVLAASRTRYARKHQSAAVALLERLGIALGALTHVIVTRGGLAARRGYLSAARAALRPQSHSPLS
jgi:GT2 family glycosyltransferase